MDIKVLLQILNRPWMMEPTAARQWAGIASRIINGENIPLGPSPDWVYGAHYRVDRKGVFSLKGEVAVMNIDGPIMKHTYCGAPGTQSLTRKIHNLNNDPSVQALLLYIDSPGGSADGTEDFAKAVKNSAKPVVAFVNSTMASAAYWIGSATSHIVATGANKGHMATIGSIGTMVQWADYSGKYEKEGIKIHEVYASKSTDKNQFFAKANEGDYEELIKTQLDPLNETFLSAIKFNRKGKLKLDQENVLSGKTYNAKEALKFGLIDQVGDFQSAVKTALKLSKKQAATAGSKINQTMNFERTLAAAQAESFEALNEGIWLTEENISNIEAVLEGNDTEIQSLNDQVNQMTTESETNKTTLDQLQEQVDQLEGENAALSQEVKDLGEKPEDPKQTTKEKDEFKKEETETHYAHNEWADKVMGL